MKHVTDHSARSLGFLSRYHDGELTAAEKEDFLRHAAGCAECAATAAEYESVLAMYRESAVEPPDGSLAARISRRIDAELRHRAPVRFLALEIDLLWASVVAIGLVGVLAVYGVYGRRTATAPPETIAAKVAAPAETPVETPPAEESARDRSAILERGRSAPESAPKTIAAETADRSLPPIPEGVGGGVEGGVPGGVAGGVVGGVPSSPVAVPEQRAGLPAPAPSSDRAAPAAGAVSELRSEAKSVPPAAFGETSAPVLLRRIEPVFSPEERRFMAGPPVVVEAAISEKGEVTGVRVLRSNPPLDGAVVRAVRQWRYRPAFRSGRPVEAHLTISISIDGR